MRKAWIPDHILRQEVDSMSVAFSEDLRSIVWYHIYKEVTAEIVVEVLYVVKEQ